LEPVASSLGVEQPPRDLNGLNSSPVRVVKPAASRQAQAQAQAQTRDPSVVILIGTEIVAERVGIRPTLDE
jgi:hypothetical protein